MKKSRITNETRKAVYRRDGFACAVCGDNRRLQIHHITKRSAGGGDEQMNLVTLCSVCHALAHGINLAGIDLTREDVEQSVVEYMSDLYADLGFRWPDGEILEGREVLPSDLVQIRGTGRCWACVREGCIHREAYRRLPKEVGGLGLCPGEILEVKEPAEFDEAIDEWFDSFAHPAEDDPDWPTALVERAKQGYGKGGTK